MGILSWYQRFHWRFFNALVRLFGVMLVVFGALTIISGVYYAFNPAAAEGMETAGVPPWLLNVLVGAGMVGIGIPLLRVDSYRPDLGDAAWTFATTTSKDALSQSRTWWTGEPRASSQSGDRARRES